MSLSDVLVQSAQDSILGGFQSEVQTKESFSLEGALKAVDSGEAQSSTVTTNTTKRMYKNIRTTVHRQRDVSVKVVTQCEHKPLFAFHREYFATNRLREPDTLTYTELKNLLSEGYSAVEKNLIKEFESKITKHIAAKDWQKMYDDADRFFVSKKCDLLMQRKLCASVYELFKFTFVPVGLVETYARYAHSDMLTVITSGDTTISNSVLQDVVPFGKDKVKDTINQSKLYICFSKNSAAKDSSPVSMRLISVFNFLAKNTLPSDSVTYTFSRFNLLKQLPNKQGRMDLMQDGFSIVDLRIHLHAEN